MKRYIEGIITVIVLMLGLITPFAPTLVHASPASDACEGVKAAGGECDTSAGTTGFTKIITTVINILSIVVGAVSVIMIIIGGFRYVISSGDSNAMSGAKNTILYAIIGLVIVIFARTIVAFVFTKTTDTTKSSPTPTSPTQTPTPTTPSTPTP